MKNENKRSRYYAVRLNETHNCEPEFVERCGGAVYTVYIYNGEEITHCCELTPSYWLEEIENVPRARPEDERADNALANELLDALTGEGIYVHCHTLDAVRVRSRAEIVGGNWFPDAPIVRKFIGRFESADEAREKYQGSPEF